MVDNLLKLGKKLFMKVLIPVTALLNWMKININEILNRELVLSVICLWWKVSFYEQQSLFSNIWNWRHKQKKRNAFSPARELFWMTSEQSGFDSWKNVSYRYSIISKDFICLGKTV